MFLRNTPPKTQRCVSPPPQKHTPQNTPPKTQRCVSKNLDFLRGKRPNTTPETQGCVSPPRLKHNVVFHKNTTPQTQRCVSPTAPETQRCVSPPARICNPGFNYLVIGITYIWGAIAMIGIGRLLGAG